LLLFFGHGGKKMESTFAGPLLGEEIQQILVEVNSRPVDFFRGLSSDRPQVLDVGDRRFMVLLVLPKTAHIFSKDQRAGKIYWHPDKEEWRTTNGG